jgi:hypothetical protein
MIIVIHQSNEKSRRSANPGLFTFDDLVTDLC